MAKDLNQCNFIGRLGRDPEIRYTQGGSAIARFSLAVGDDYKDKSGNKVEQTNWINIVAFGKLAEIIEKYLSKGSQVFVSGKLTVRKWQDQEGNDKWTTEVVANDLQMLGSRSGGGSGVSSPQESVTHPQDNSNTDDFDSDIPF